MYMQCYLGYTFLCLNYFLVLNLVVSELDSDRSSKCYAFIIMFILKFF